MKKILNYSCFIIIFLIGIVDICYGINYESKQDKFLKNADKVVAIIYETKNNEDGSQVLYINYYVNGKKYDNMLVVEKKFTNKSSIEIFYSKKNPLNIKINQIDKKECYIIYIGIGTIFFNIILLINFVIQKMLKT